MLVPSVHLFSSVTRCAFVAHALCHMSPSLPVITSEFPTDNILLIPRSWRHTRPWWSAWWACWELTTPHKSPKRLYSWRHSWPTYADDTCAHALRSVWPWINPMSLHRSPCQNTMTKEKTSAPCTTASPSSSCSALLLVWVQHAHTHTHVHRSQQRVRSCVLDRSGCDRLRFELQVSILRSVSGKSEAVCVCLGDDEATLTQTHTGHSDLQRLSALQGQMSRLQNGMKEVGREKSRNWGVCGEAYL